MKQKAFFTVFEGLSFGGKKKKKIGEIADTRFHSFYEVFFS